MPRFFNHALVALVLIFSCGLPPASAQEAAVSDFQFHNSVEEIPERGEVMNCIIRFAGVRFTFLPPQGWNFQARVRDQSIVFSSPEPGLYLTLRFFAASTNLPPLDKTDAWVDRVRGEHADAEVQVRSRGPVHADGVSGLGFDVEPLASGRPRVLRRYAYFSGPTWLMRCELAGLPEAVESNNQIQAMLLTSLRIQTPAASKGPAVVADPVSAQPAP